MKAVSIHTLSGPEVVTYEDIPSPVPHPEERPSPLPFPEGRGWEKERW
jgi:hypothetical protein